MKGRNLNRELEVQYLGDSCLLVSLVDAELSLESSRVILGAYQRLKESLRAWPEVRDVVPAYTSLAIYFDPLNINFEVLKEVVLESFKICDLKEDMGKKHVFPVCYDGEDLERVAEMNNLSIDQVVELHTQAEYTVAMIGFKPYFPYLIGLDPRLETGRLESPRNRVPAGSVAIGGAQTGVYPEESPGGWNLIGHMDAHLLKKLEPGDRVLFRRNEDVD